MNLYLTRAVILATLILGEVSIRAADQETPATKPGEENSFVKFVAQFDWVKGPATAEMGEIAEIKLPEGYVFTGAKGTQGILKAWGNPTSGDELGLVGPTSLEWTVIFEFSEVGYIKDDEKSQLDAEKLLKSIQKGTEQSNKLREQMGAPPMHVTGWLEAPKYNPETHNLEWAIRGESAGREVVNYNTRLLGRKGVMSVTLLVDPAKMTETLPVYRNLLSEYGFKSGERYAEYRQGDKLAKYGLTALIVGGTAVGAAKLGFFAWLAVAFKKFWKVLVIGLVAAAAGIRRLLFGVSGKEVR